MALGGAKAERQVARLIHRGAAHPAPGRVRLVGALLKDHRCGRHGAQLKPAHTCHAARTHGIISHDRFVAVAELAIGEPEHQTVANAVQLVASFPTGAHRLGLPDRAAVKPAAAGLPMRLKVVLAGVTKSAWKSRTL